MDWPGNYTVGVEEMIESAGAHKITRDSGVAQLLGQTHGSEFEGQRIQAAGPWGGKVAANALICSAFQLWL